MTLLDVLTNLISKAPSRRRRNGSPHVTPQPAQQALEPRMLMSGTSLAGGTWNITGTNGADAITVLRDEVDSDVLVVEINGEIVDEQFASDVDHIQIIGRGGNDRIVIDEVAGAINIPATIWGGAGDDFLQGGSGLDRLFGGSGHDQLIQGQNEQLIAPFASPTATRVAAVNTPVALAAAAPVVQAVKNRIPAEWERHDSTWMQWPKGEEASYRSNFAGIIKALQRFEQVNLAVESQRTLTDAKAFLQQRGVPLTNVQFHIMPYDWSWMRDNGAIWVEQSDSNGVKKMAIQDWGFDGWGGDGGPSRKDDAVPRLVAKIEGVAVETIPVFLEKGTLEFNGKDTVITSWPVLHDRNPAMTRAQLEVTLKQKFGVTKVVWLEAKPAGDITDGHVDGIARFINPTTVVVSRYLDKTDPDYAAFEQSAAIIQKAGFKVVRLDIPGNITYRGELLPANYTNFLVANGAIIASSYGNATFDANARKQLQAMFPGREVILTDTRELWYNGGAVHCVTNDQPLLVAAKAATGTGIVS